MLASDEHSEDHGPDQIPGYLGLIWDGQATFESPLAPLDGFDFWNYAQLGHELEETGRRLVVDFGSGSAELRFEVDEVEEINGAIPGVEAIFDCPDDLGPAGGSGHLLVLASGFTAADVTQAALTLRAALESDLAAMTATLTGG